MILSDVAIRELIATGKLKILPEFDLADIRPSGIRLHLGSELLVPVDGQVVDISKQCDVEYQRVAVPPEGYLLRPNKFVLGSTYERIMTPRDIVGHLEGRSTIARLGLSVHCTSGAIDGNHDEPRSVVLELKNMGTFDIILKARIALAMLMFSELTHPVSQKSQSQYRDQSGVLPPNLRFVKNT